MRIASAEFLTSAVLPTQYPINVGPEIAFVGRSNVGKSSLINALLNRRGLAKTSSTPGKTRTINFFRINGKLGFVDLPGYGYAQVSKAERASWGPMVGQLFEMRQELAGVVQLIDVRHAPTADDQQTYAWLQQWGRPLLIVATKADKIGRTQRSNHLAQITDALQTEESTTVVLFSALTGEGRERIWEWMRQVTGV